MRCISILIILIGLSLIGCASTVQLPSSLNIISPSPEVPQQIAAFSGIWKGRWKGALEIVVVVEEIDTNVAKVLYSWGYNTGSKSGYIYRAAKVLPGPAIEWIEDNGDIYMFKMDISLNKIEGSSVEKTTGAKAVASLRRINADKLTNIKTSQFTYPAYTHLSKKEQDFEIDKFICAKEAEKMGIDKTDANRQFIIQDEIERCLTMDFGWKSKKADDY